MNKSKDQKKNKQTRNCFDYSKSIFLPKLFLWRKLKRRKLLRRTKILTSLKWINIIEINFKSKQNEKWNVIYNLKQEKNNNFLTRWMIFRVYNHTQNIRLIK